jgi:hypothetical protein
MFILLVTLLGYIGTITGLVQPIFKEGTNKNISKFIFEKRLGNSYKKDLFTIFEILDRPLSIRKKKGSKKWSRFGKEICITLLGDATRI